MNTELEAYKEKVKEKIASLRPFFSQASIGDFTAAVPNPSEEDEFTEIFVGLTVMLQVIQEQLGKLKKADEMKDQFLALAAHQLRSPLAVMKWDVELLLQDKDKFTSDAAEKIVNLYKSSERMAELINDILAASRIDQQKVKTTVTSVNILATIQTVVHELLPLISRKEVKIEYIPPQDIQSVYVDENQIKEVLLNVLSNSIKFTPPLGTIEITFKYDQSTQFLEIIVSDSGIGIPQDEIPRVGEKFFRATNATSAQTAGTGLGIFICKTYLDVWGAKMEIQSPANEEFRNKWNMHDLSGTTVTLFLPTQKAHQFVPHREPIERGGVLS